MRNYIRPIYRRFRDQISVLRIARTMRSCRAILRRRKLQNVVTAAQKCLSKARTDSRETTLDAVMALLSIRIAEDRCTCAASDVPKDSHLHACPTFTGKAASERSNSRERGSDIVKVTWAFDWCSEEIRRVGDASKQGKVCERATRGSVMSSDHVQDLGIVVSGTSESFVVEELCRGKFWLTRPSPKPRLGRPRVRADDSDRTDEKREGARQY